MSELHVYALRIALTPVVRAAVTKVAVDVLE